MTTIMSRTFLAMSNNRGLTFSSGLYEKMYRDFLADHEGEQMRVTLARPRNSERIRGYYWACVVPTASECVPEWATLSTYQVHECLKKMFDFFEARNPLTNRVERFGGRVMGENSTTQECMAYIVKVADFLITKYNKALPDPEQYKTFLDSAPLISDEIKAN